MILKFVAGIAVALVLLVVVYLLIARQRSSTVHVERTFPAPVARVWKLWNDPESMKKWWGPKDYTAPVIQNDFRVNGNFLLSMKSPKGDMHWNTGNYKEIVEHRRIVSTLSFADARGQVIPGREVFLPGVWPDSITVTVEFREADGKTMIAVNEEGIPLIMKLFATLGWRQQFDKFEGLLSGETR